MTQLHSLRRPSELYAPSLQTPPPTSLYKDHTLIKATAAMYTALDDTTASNHAVAMENACPLEPYYTACILALLKQPPTASIPALSPRTVPLPIRHVAAAQMRSSNQHIEHLIALLPKTSIPSQVLLNFRMVHATTIGTTSEYPPAAGDLPCNITSACSLYGGYHSQRIVQTPHSKSLQPTPGA